MWKAILEEKEKAKEKRLPTSILFLFVCNSPFQGMLNLIRKQSFVRVWPLYPKPVKEFKKFYFTLRSKLEKLGRLHEGSFPKDLQSSHRLNQICEAQDVRHLLNQMVFLYRTMSALKEVTTMKRESRLPLSNFDCTLVVLAHQLPMPLKHLPTFLKFQGCNETLLLRHVFALSTQPPAPSDPKKAGASKQFEPFRQMVQFVDQHSRETTPLMIMHNILPMALGFDKGNSMNQTWIRLFSEDVEHFSK